jgi:predicted ATPase
LTPRGFISLRRASEKPITANFAVAYAVYAVILEEVLGDYQSALAFEKLSIKLADKYNSSYAKCIAYFVAGALVSHWTRPCKTSIDYLQHSVEYGMQSGELLYTGYSIYLMIEERYLKGDSLTDVDDVCRKWYGFVRQMKLDFVLSFIIGLRRLLRTLGGQEDDFQLRMTDELENSVVDKIMKSDTETAARHNFFDLQLCYLYGRYDEALTVAEKLNPKVLSGFMLSWTYRFYQSLTIAAVFPDLQRKDRRKFLSILRSNLRRIKKLSDICPENFAHQYQLLSAEYARINGNG